MQRNSPRPPWHRLYKTARWQRLREQTFTRDLYTCQMSDCGVVISEPRRRICDHRKPHRGDEALFWDPENLQTLCKACHDTAKQREEQGSLHQRGVWD